ncbi:Por secretion system C-terminal sorting domain-containing protein [Flavobacterium segetis]|uniref:Por secretion system C-terminal sorting domain-containing protein n=1 Tax=Flavobacterium segetis TaxID=271157 RepID=A0A1M5JSB0_9FLAO|nr:LamG-like jellyroll fold domain-containing protein [Flavobacterium segetis]SHG43180.1 Por secretion system C-terminal sorting domain-containing protein [Flavobacterium segetis]
MKKIIIALFLGLIATGLRAQNTEGAKVVPASQAIQKNGFTIQVGLPYLGQNVNTTSRIVQPVDVRFPWNVLYLFPTFAEESFDVSKGYFGDKILISWDLRSNFDKITSIKIYKREYNVAQDKPYQFVGSVSPSVTQYEDRYAEGGVLFQYKIVAEGVSKIESLYSTYITGFGYRNPTAVVTGNISYKGGNPVKDVIVMASSAGTSVNQGGSLLIPATTNLKIENFNSAITTAVTYQAWAKPKSAYTDDAGTAIKLFQLKSLDNKTIDASVQLQATSKKIVVKIGTADYVLENYYPSGLINSRGDDVMIPVSNFNTNFMHFSVIMKEGAVPTLLINGRAISSAYKDLVNTKLQGTDPSYTAPYFNVTIPTATNTLKIAGADTQWKNIYVGGGRDAYHDEIRVWKAVLEAQQIRTDYSRYISGNDSRLVAYLRANEKVGQFAYDLSRDGFNYNKNHGKLGDAITAVTWANAAGDFPTSSQLGILGVTDAKGNYEITAIPYSGTGESFTITPLYGQHKFEPGQQLVFLGQGSEVVNKISFIDNSSFSFKGQIAYNTRGVFPSYVEVDTKLPTNEGTSWINGPGILDEGYNYYTKGSEKFSKGQYWLNNNGTPTDTTDDYLDRYASIKTQGANVFIDGIIVLDENSMPVVTDDTGYFDISVPIGNHYITVKKDGHEFTYNGRFPAGTGSTKEFFEDSNEAVVFVDNTKVTVIGKVVGGSIEAAKKAGFGEDGLKTVAVKDVSGNTKTIDVSTRNNIGVAAFTLGYAPAGSTVTPYTRTSFNTNITSGEYRVSLLPLQYELKAENVTISKNTSIALIKAGTSETLNFAKVEATTKPTFTYTDNSFEKKLEGKPYHYEKSFVYRSTPVLQVTEQTSDKKITVNGTDVETGDFTNPVYSQFKEYQIVLNRFERYTNKDSGTAVEIKVPVSDGELIANNNLALIDSGKLVVDSNNESKLTYTFKGGLPSIAPPFTITSSLKYRINEVDYDVEGYNPTGIILGGKSDGSQTFVTAAPDIPEIILRDPPGSNSFASIEKGESISFTTENSFANSEGFTTDFKIMGGVKFAAGGGLVGPIIESEGFNNINVGIGVNHSSSDGKSLTKTYTFSKTISTSDDPDFVGSMGDLYIGNSKNQFYGSFDDVKPSTTVPKKTVNGVQQELASFEYVNLGTTDVPLYVSKQKAVYFVDEPSETFFVYSQKHILETLIPEYELFITNIDNGTLIPGKDGALSKAQYLERIRLWKKLILDNELNKYLAKNNRIDYKAKVTNVLNEFNTSITNEIEEGNAGPTAEKNLRDKLTESKKTSDLLNQYFQKNISFDAGVGEYSQSVETSIINTTSLAYNLTIDESFGLDIGFAVNSTGILTSTKGVFQQDINSSLTEESTQTTTVGYTLKDNDTANFLSVDVVNAFDGNGPIFITQGGRTSCPYEGAEESVFFSDKKFKDYIAASLAFDKSIIAKQKEIDAIKDNKNTPKATRDYNEYLRSLLRAQKQNIITQKSDLEKAFSSNIECCVNDDKARLSYATQKLEVPVLKVTAADVSNITEGRNAEFELILENQSAAGINADYKLVVDNTSNPDNAIINIEPNGTIVNVPYGKAITYKLTLGKSISDVYDYKNIKIRLESLCDGADVSSEVTISAQFVPSCSLVLVNAPLSNWVYNREVAYNTDGTTKPLQVKLNGYNTKFASFKKIDLEYRLATASNWTRLQTYYGTQVFYDAAVLASETNIKFIGTDAILNYAFDIAALKLADGRYEIRARSTCTNDTEFISDITTGRVDLNAPLRFGTPLPIDGILGAGEDLKVSFNEPIFYNSAVSTIEIKGQTNQLEIDNNVSLRFDGTTNQAVINSPRITSGDLAFEFWMKNSTTSNEATILSQKEGVTIKLLNGSIYFTLGNLTVSGGVANDGLFHHYTFTHKNNSGTLRIYQDDKEIGASIGVSNAQFSNNNALNIGGNTFIGNMHDLRLWSKDINLDEAYAKMYAKLIGNEANLVGYWPMDEGRGTIANDKARFKHAIVKEVWDIKPKGTSYEFTNDQYLTLDKVGSVQLTKEMDATISFWMKTGISQEATLFSNGKGDGSDLIQSNGLSNKWAINLKSNGKLTFETEGNSYELASQNMADNSWHHVTLLFNRLGSLRTYVDAVSVSSNLMATIGGFSGNKIWLGARGSSDITGSVAVDRTYTGKLDEFRLWNTLRNVEQITRDRFNEISPESIGLMLYAKMNQPDPITANGPRYFHVEKGQSGFPDNAILNAGVLKYSEDVPPIKPERTLIKFQVNNVVNQDQMILEPVVTDWASLEGQIIDITVDKMFDSANNMQQSPITWTAYVKRNEVSWFAEGYNEVIDIVKKTGEEKSFEITLLNKGGKGQPYIISNLPKWLTLSKTSGTISPDSRVIIIATIDKELTPAEYLESIFLKTDFGYDEKMQIKLRVLAAEPNWTVNPANYKYSMNIVGRIKVDGNFSEDNYDRIAAFSNGQARGVAKLIYNSSYKQYYAFLTIYSNSTSIEPIDFKIWDASRGITQVAVMNEQSSIIFQENAILGKLSLPVIFENSTVVVQNIAFNAGWTWISMNVNDPSFSNLNALTKDLKLETSDRMLTNSPARLENYFKNEALPANSGWSGTISTYGGLNNSKMIKVFMTHEQPLTIKGTAVDVANWSFPIQENWNWLPYTLSGNQQTNEALAYFEATDGDVVKSQNLFAIYDPLIGWNGTLNYLESGKGYMIKSSKAQTFKYPSYLANTRKLAKTSKIKNEINASQETIKDEFKQYPDNMNAVVLLPAGYNKLFAYDSKGVLKGSTVNQTVNDGKLSFITVYGDTEEDLVFYIGDEISNKKTSKKFIFKGNDVLGTIAKPLILEDMINPVSIYPSPFDNEITINANANKDQSINIRLFSISGKLVLEVNQNVIRGENILKIQPNVGSGVYLLQITINEETITQKVIKN